MTHPDDRVPAAGVPDEDGLYVSDEPDVFPDIPHPPAVSAKVAGPDLHCRRCNSTLDGLPVDGNCPRCGTSIDFSLHGDLLRNADPGWLNTLRLAAKTMVIGELVVIAFECLQIILASILAIAEAMDRYLADVVSQKTFLWCVVGMIVLPAIGMLIVLTGSWMITAREPNPADGRTRAGVRAIIRIALTLAATGLCIQGVSVLPVLRAQPPVDFVVLSHFSMLAGCIGWAALFYYIRQLALRVPTRASAQWARILLYTFPIMWGLRDVLILLFHRILKRGTTAREGAFVVCILVIGFALLMFEVMFVTTLGGLASRIDQQTKIARRNAGMGG